MSIAPRDSHEAQVQFALERGVPAIIVAIYVSGLHIFLRMWEQKKQPHNQASSLTKKWHTLSLR